MFRTELSSVRVLQAVAVIAGLAVLLWSLGLPSLKLVNAASLTSISDTLSDSAPNVVSNHTIAFTLPTDGTPLASADTVTITFPAATFDLSNLNHTDFDVATGSDYTLEQGGSPAADNIGVATTSNTIVLTLGSAVAIATGTAISVEVGTNATFGASGVDQIVNPASSSYEINIETNEGDSGATRVVILDNVTVTASVDTIFDFTVAGVGAAGGGETVNGETISGTTTATTIAFGTLASGTASTTAQDLTVSTNASQGYSVTVQVDQTLLSSTGADIDLFEDADTPTTWTAPVPSIGDDSTYGYWGITSEDGTTTRGTEFDVVTGNEWIGASTTPRIVMGADGPADGVTQGVGAARVGFRAEINSLQEAGDDYTATLTYVATPIF